MNNENDISKTVNVSDNYVNAIEDTIGKYKQLEELYESTANEYIEYNRKTEQKTDLNYVNSISIDISSVINQSVCAVTLELNSISNQVSVALSPLKMPQYELSSVQKNIKKTIDEKMLQMSKIVEQTIDNILSSIKKVITAINGWIDTSSLPVDMKKTADELGKMIKNMTNSPLSKLGLTIPGMSEISEVVDLLKNIDVPKIQTEKQLDKFLKDNADTLKFKIKADAKKAVKGITTTQEKTPELTTLQLQVSKDFLASIQASLGNVQMLMIPIQCQMLIELATAVNTLAVAVNTLASIHQLNPIVSSPIALITPVNAPLLLTASTACAVTVQKLPGQIDNAITSALKQVQNASVKLSMPTPLEDIDMPPSE